MLKGDEAPLLSQLKDWMEMHPGWEVLSDSEDSGDDSQDDDGTFYYSSFLFLLRSRGGDFRPFDSPDLWSVEGEHRKPYESVSIK